MLKKDKALKYFFFFVKYLFNEEKIEFKTLNSQGSSGEPSKVMNPRIVNLNEEGKRIKGKKFNLFQETKSKNDYLSDNEVIFEGKSECKLQGDPEQENNFDFSNTIVFASITKSTIDKWVCAINHFIKK